MPKLKKILAVPTPMQWHRFDNYEIKDNFIVPDLESKFVTYDPWLEYVQAVADYSPEAPPAHEALMRLVYRVRLKATGNVKMLDDEDLKAIRQWCSDNGLLGLALHQAQTVPFAMATPLAPAAPSAWIAPHYQNVLGGSSFARNHQYPNDPNMMTAPLPSFAEWAVVADSSPRDGSNIFFEGRAAWERQSEGILSFFSSADSLVMAIFELQEFGALAAAGRTKNVIPPDGAVRVLAACLSNATTVVEPLSDGSIGHRTMYSSLLSMLAAMAHDDLLIGKNRVVACESCGELFRTRRSRARFCSLAHKKREEMRRRRAKLKR